MTQKHPITPPPELVNKIFGDALRGSDGQHDYELRLIHAAYAAGADQELESCAKWVEANFGQLPTHNLHQFRRPKPPTLKEQALKQLVDLERVSTGDYSAIRCALQALDD